MKKLDRTKFIATNDNLPYLFKKRIIIDTQNHSTYKTTQQEIINYPYVPYPEIKNRNKSKNENSSRVGKTTNL